MGGAAKAVKKMPTAGKAIKAGAKAGGMAAALAKRCK